MLTQETKSILDKMINQLPDGMDLKDFEFHCATKYNDELKDINEYRGVKISTHPLLKDDAVYLSCLKLVRDAQRNLNQLVNRKQNHLGTSKNRQPQVPRRF